MRAPYYNNASLLDPTEPQKTTRLLDKPPLPPEISFQTYNGVPNKVLLLLNQNYGQQLLIPNSQIFLEDSIKINAYKEAQKEDGNPPGHLLYKTDDGQGIYEIYRLSAEPDSWSSFRNISRVKKTTLNSTLQSGFEDTLVPNNDYYYFARFVDVHGNISNPTDIFKVRMVQTEGFPAYMVLTTFSFKRPQLVTRRPFKKYIKIALSDSLREVEGEDASNAQVLYKPPSGELKKYKFRITSIKTGKKIDINVDMKKTIIDKFAVVDLDALGGDKDGAPIVDPGNPSQSEPQKEGAKAANSANFGTGPGETCTD